MKVYLSGPISLVERQHWHWAERAKNLLRGAGFEVVSPYDRKFPPTEKPVNIVNYDIALIEACDFVLLNAELPSWGAAMEIRIAFDYDLPVVAFNSRTLQSPWLLAHCDAVLPTLEEAVQYLANTATEEP